MSEEIRNPNMELSDAALSGVGGGVDSTNSYMLAAEICSDCRQHDRSRFDHCGYRSAKLADYIRSNGAIGGYTPCPFYK